MARELYIFGASTLARLACLAAQETGAFNVVGFVVDDGLDADTDVLGLPVHRWSDALCQPGSAGTAMFCAVGYRSMKARAAVFERIRGAGFDLVSILMPGAHLSPHAHIGPGNFLMAGSVVEPGARLGANNVVWSNATVCHDTQIGSHNFLAAGSTVGGHVHLGDRNFLGFGSIVREHCRVGSDILIGAQSLVLSDTSDPGVYVGAPARRLRDIDADLGVTIE